MPPPPYPPNPVVPLARWLVRMVVDGSMADDPWRFETRVWAYSSSDAVGRARAEFYGTWATQADRQRNPLRVLEVLQETV